MTRSDLKRTMHSYFNGKMDSRTEHTINGIASIMMFPCYKQELKPHNIAIFLYVFAMWPYASKEDLDRFTDGPFTQHELNKITRTLENNLDNIRWLVIDTLSGFTYNKINRFNQTSIFFAYDATFLKLLMSKI